MLEVLEKPLPLSDIYKEFNLSPALDYHNNFASRIFSYLDRLLEGSELEVKFDTFRYLEDWLINAFGDFKNMMNLEKFVEGLQRFGASQKFIQHKIEEYSGVGTMHPGYAPDVFIVDRAERNNQFGIPLVAIEIISKHSRESDLHFKPYFYETIGVREYFIGEPKGEAGTIIQAYRLENDHYQPIPLQGDGYHSRVVGHTLPKRWEIK